MTNPPDSLPPDDAHVASAEAHLAAATQSVASATADLARTTPELPPVPPITSVEEFERALIQARPGTVLTLDPAFVYPSPLTIGTPVTIQSVVPPGRIPADCYLPRFLMGVSAAADAVTLRGLEVRNSNVAADILIVGGVAPVVDRCRILGDPVKGGKRGIRYTGTAGQILGCRVDDIRLPAQETQAVYAQDMGPGLILDDCFLCAAGEAVMFGGGDSSSPERMPRNIRITRCTLTKRAEWLALTAGSYRYVVKNALELKAAADVVVTDCILEYAGISAGQSGCLIVLTPRNQGGRAPWSTVEHVSISRCVGRYASSGVMLMGDDNVHPSGRLTDVRLEELTFDLDPSYGGANRAFTVTRAPDRVTIDSVTITGKIKSVVYFDEAKPPTGLKLKNLKPPAGVIPYAYHNVMGDTLASLQLYAPDAVLDVRATDGGATPWTPIG